MNSQALSILLLVTQFANYKSKKSVMCVFSSKYLPHSTHPIYCNRKLFQMVAKSRLYFLPIFLFVQNTCNHFSLAFDFINPVIPVRPVILRINILYTLAICPFKLFLLFGTIWLPYFLKTDYIYGYKFSLEKTFLSYLILCLSTYSWQLNTFSLTNLNNNLI